MQADRYLAQNYYRRAVTALGAAVADLERAVSWAGKSMTKNSVRTVERVQKMSKRMREGLRVSPEEISAAISELKKPIARHEALAAGA